MSRYVRCPDCHRMFASRDKLSAHAGWHPFNHPKANRLARKHKRDTRKAARRSRREAEYESGSDLGLGSRQSPSVKTKLAAHRRAQGVS